MHGEPSVHEAAARIVALMVAATGAIGDSALQALDRVDGFRSLGIDRRRFTELADAYASEIGSHLGETSWLRDEDRRVLDDLLQQVTDPRQRRLVLRLVTTMIEANRCVSNEERMVRAHLLASWREP
jgi:hypothetical protein